MVEALLHHLINNFSYLGVFISSFITDATVLIPLPSQVVLVLAVAFKLNIFLTALATAAGSMTGELIGYGLGVAGGKLVKDKFKKHRKLVKTIRHYYHKYAFWVIFVTAFLIFPFDLVGIITGLSRYDIKKFLLAGFLGKFLKTIVLYILIQNGIRIFTGL